MAGLPQCICAILCHGQELLTFGPFGLCILTQNLSVQNWKVAPRTLLKFAERGTQSSDGFLG